VRDIAQEAGILSGSLYHHFSSKEEMVKEIIGSGPLETSGYRSIIEAAPTRADALRGCVLFAVAWVARNPDVARILRNDAQYIRETPALAETESRRQRGRLLWLEVVEAGIVEGEFRDDLDADLVVRAMWDSVLASIRWFPPLGDSDPSYVAQHLAEFYLGGVRGPRRSGASPTAGSRTARRRRRAPQGAP
jgi:AcrR family transcriptional regulator